MVTKKFVRNELHLDKTSKMRKIDYFSDILVKKDIKIFVILLFCKKSEISNEPSEPATGDVL